MLDKSILVGMSGGVDSSVALLLLKKAGYAVSGATIVMFKNEDIGLAPDDRVCGSAAELEAAKKLAKKLECSHYTLSGKDDFQNSVLEYFSNAYEDGKTPNPCVVCNKTVKIPKLIEKADELGIEKIATGHYARVTYDENTKKYKLFRALDDKKDQSYFLYKLGQKELSRLIFPLGGFTKSEIRKIAEDAGFESAKKADSQDICFVQNRSYVDFLVNIMKKELKEGDFLSTTGEKLGKHKGLIAYTVGQRKGLGTAFGTPMYVLSKNAKDNSIVLGTKDELFSKEMFLTEANSISGEPFLDGIEVNVKTRYVAKMAKARIFNEEYGILKVVFDESQKALTPGQSAVFYLGDEVLGGGTIAI